MPEQGSPRPSPRSRRASPPGWLVAGSVGRPHGLDGSFVVQQARGELLAEGTTVAIGERTVRIARRAGVAQRPIVRLEGCADRGDAQALRGQELRVAAPGAAQLGEREWWAEELEGCRVVDGAREVGEVRSLLGLPSCDALEVERPDGGRLLVPLVADAVRQVDVAARRIDVRLSFLGEDG